ncbi:hypothetical protein CEXT_250801 [Caerostris extrusa]|uniref:Uncharacterized protein n=1 Tax=Caerostris extrusa TaxID=172846 RepID=A0AAV4TAM7_CAEEX|nr:hypothetical protein CEXT_250801 [Caerostris extrusa]
MRTGPPGRGLAQKEQLLMKRRPPGCQVQQSTSDQRAARLDLIAGTRSPTTREREKLISSCCLFREIDCNRKNHIALTLMTLVTEGLGPEMVGFDYYKADTLLEAGVRGSL